MHSTSDEKFLTECVSNIKNVYSTNKSCLAIKPFSEKNLKHAWVILKTDNPMFTVFLQMISKIIMSLQSKTQQDFMNSSIFRL